MEGRRRDWLRGAVAERGGSADPLAVCAVCVEVLPAVDGAAVSLRSGQRAQALLAASDDWAAGVEEAQYVVGEGPGVAAHEAGTSVSVGDLAAEAHRWPAFAEMASGMGVASVFAFPLRLGGIRLGVLTLCGRRIGTLSGAEAADAAVLADLALSAVLDHAAAAEGRGEEWLETANSYQDVNIATGMLAAQLGISLADAFVRLRAHAFAQGRPVREVAADVLTRRLPLDRLSD